jgi:hypothetical protein
VPVFPALSVAVAERLCAPNASVYAGTALRLLLAHVLEATPDSASAAVQAIVIV